MLSNPNYKITMLLDHGAMITVQMEKYGGGSHSSTHQLNLSCIGQ